MPRRVGHNGWFATRHILHEDEIRSAFTAIGKEATVGILVLRIDALYLEGIY